MARLKGGNSEPRKISSNTQARQSAALEDVMCRGWSCDWKRDTDAKQAFKSLSSAQSLHAHELTGGALTDWKSAAIIALKEARAGRTTSIPGPVGPADTLQPRSGVAPAVPSALPMTSRERRGDNLSAAALKAVNSVRHTTEPENLNVLGQPVDIPRYRKPHTLGMGSSGGLAQSGVRADTLPTIATASDDRGASPVQEPSNQILFNIGGSSGFPETEGVPPVREPEW